MVLSSEIKLLSSNCLNIGYLSTNNTGIDDSVNSPDSNCSFIIKYI